MSSSRKRPSPTRRPTRHAAQLLVLSARTATALDAACARLADHLEAHPRAGARRCGLHAASGPVGVHPSPRPRRCKPRHKRLPRCASHSARRSPAVSTKAVRGRWRFCSADRAASMPAWAAGCTTPSRSTAMRSTAARRSCNRCSVKTCATRLFAADGDAALDADAAGAAGAVRDRVRAGHAVACTGAWCRRRCSATASASTSPRTWPA